MTMKENNTKLGIRVKGMYYVCIVVCIGAHIYLRNNDNIHMIFTCARCWPVNRCVLADSQWEPSQN